MGTGPDDLLNDPAFRRQLQKRLKEGWTLDKIEPMSTEDILAKLKQFGLPVTVQYIQEMARQFESAVAMSEEWRRRYRFRGKGRYDEDFVWMAAIILWKRLVTDHICFELIDQQMQNGYDLLEAGKTGKALEAWWLAWQWVKGKVTAERNTPQALDEAYPGMNFVSNWCQDFDMELENAAGHDSSYHRLRVQYCQEFLATFPAVDWEMRGNFLRAEAEAHWRSGAKETADAKFAALIEAHPDWAWGYIGWADEYWLFDESPKDYARGEAILQQALARPNLEDRQEVLDRLNDLRTERKKKQRKR